VRKPIAAESFNAAITDELSGEIWGVTCCFNPAQYKNKYDHMRRFSMAARKQGMKLLVVELALSGLPFVLDDRIADKIVQLRSDTVLWHKERLLNLAVAALPPECDKVIWVDADLLFENDGWIEATASLLKLYMLVQPFAVYYPLEKDEDPPDRGVATRVVIPGLAYARQAGDKAAIATALPGGAWAARRSLIEKHGIYDRFILGGGDAAVGWAIYGLTNEWLSRGWFRRLLPAAAADHLRVWSDALFADVQSSVAYVPGRVFHLWHGSVNRRRYVTRFAILADAAFDPQADIALDASECWQWSSDKPQLHRKVAEYFQHRREEG
jgi:hypothetical protein